MIRSYNGVRLLSSYLIRDSCKSIYKGVFHRTLDSGVTTLSRVLRGEGEVGRLDVINPNNRVLSNASVRGSASLSTQDYETYQFYSDDDQFYTGEAEDDFPFIMDEEVKIDAGDADADDDDDDDPPIDEEGNKEYWPVKRW